MPTVKPYWLKPPRTRPLVMRLLYRNRRGRLYTARVRDRGHREVARARRHRRARSSARCSSRSRGGRRLGDAGSTTPCPGRSSTSSTSACSWASAWRRCSSPSRRDRGRRPAWCRGTTGSCARGQPRRRRLRRGPLPDASPTSSACSPGTSSCLAAPSSCSCWRRAPPGRLGADVDRPALPALRELRLAAARHALRQGLGWGRIVVYLYLDTNGILGLPLAVTATDRRRVHLLRPGAARPSAATSS